MNMYLVSTVYVVYVGIGCGRGRKGTCSDHQKQSPVIKVQIQKKIS